MHSTTLGQTSSNFELPMVSKKNLFEMALKSSSGPLGEPETETFSPRRLALQSSSRLNGSYHMAGVGTFDVRALALHSSAVQSLGAFDPRTLALKSSAVQTLTGLAQATGDPLAAINAELVDTAKRKLAEYDLYVKNIPRLDVETRKGAEDIIDTKWYPPAFLGIFPRGREDMPHIARSMRNWIKLGQILYMRPDLSISRSRFRRLEAFRDGLSALNKFLKPYIKFFTPDVQKEIQTITIKDESAMDALLERAKAMATKARAENDGQAALTARELALAAKAAAEVEGNRTDIITEATNIAAEMDKLVSVLGVARTVQEDEEPPEERVSPLTYVLLGGGVIAVGAIVYTLAKK